MAVSNQNHHSAAPRHLVYRFAQCVLDTASMDLSVNDVTVKLEPKPRELLLTLLRHSGEVVTKEELQEAVWPGRMLSESVLTKAIAKLRQALSDSDQRIIATVHGYGYKFAVPVACEQASPDAPLPSLGLTAGQAPPLRPLWRLVEQLGNGGFGEVWLAQHSKTGDQRIYKFARDANGLVALKREITLFRVLRNTYGERADFVRVLDWNLQEAPCFLEQEYLPAGDLIQWAKTKGGLLKVDLSVRLEMVAQAAEALAAAHAAGVIHKDLKPRNLLVAEGVGETPKVKIADFGSGQVLDASTLQDLSITRLGLGDAVLGENSSSNSTPLYLAPECLSGQQPTSRADIYALSIVLYQMAVGDFRQPLAPGWELEIEDPLLCEDIAQAAMGNPELRLADAAQLAYRIRNLDERHRHRKQEVAAAAETERLRDLMEKSRVRRKWLIPLAASLVMGAVLSLTGFVNARAAQLTAERAVAETRAVNQFLTDDLLGASDPYSGGRPQLTLRELLNEKGTLINSRLPDYPRSRAEIGYAFARAYEGLGDWEASGKMLTAALADARMASDEDSELKIAAQLAHVYVLQSRYDESQQLYQQVYERYQQKFGAQSEPTLQAREGLAWLKSERGNYKESLSALSGLLNDVPLKFTELRSSVLWSMAEAHMLNDQPADAEKAMQEVLELTAQEQGVTHPRYFWQHCALAESLMEQGKFEQAQTALDSALSGLSQTVGSMHPYFLHAVHDRGLLELTRNDFDAAVPWLRQAYQGRRTVHGENHVWTNWSARRLAQALAGTQQFSASIKLLTDALHGAEAMQGLGHPNSLELRFTLARVWLLAGERERAQVLLDEAHAIAATEIAVTPSLNQEFKLLLANLNTSTQ